MLDGGELRTGEDYLLNCLDGARDELRQLMQRWDNRLTLERLTFAERYREGRLAVALELEFAGHRQHIYFTACVDSKGAIGECRRSCTTVDVRQRGNADNRRQPEMFVTDIQAVQDEDGITIPSLVRLYDVEDQSNDIGASHLYLSAIKGGFQFLPVGTDWELDVFRAAPGAFDEFDRHVVKHGAKVMEDVAKPQLDFIGYWLRHCERQDVNARIRIVLDRQTVRIRLQEFGELPIKLVDVLIGPFDL